MHLFFHYLDVYSSIMQFLVKALASELQVMSLVTAWDNLKILIFIFEMHSIVIFCTFNINILKRWLFFEYDVDFWRFPILHDANRFVMNFYMNFFFQAVVVHGLKRMALYFWIGFKYLAWVLRQTIRYKSQ